MKRRGKRGFFGMGVAFLLCMLAYIPSPGSAALAWSDDFDDGNLDEWTVIECENDEGRLRITGVPGGDTWSGMAYHNSTVAAGRWEFDLIEISERVMDGPTVVRFMAIDTKFFPSTYYSIEFVRANVNTAIFRISEAAGGIGVALEDTAVSLSAKVHHIEVTRTVDGEMSLYLNGSLILDRVDTSIESSKYFLFTDNQDVALDNVKVYDTLSAAVPIELLFIGGGAAVIVIVIVVILKRR